MIVTAISFSILRNVFGLGGWWACLGPGSYGAMPATYISGQVGIYGPVLTIGPLGEETTLPVATAEGEVRIALALGEPQSGWRPYTGTFTWNGVVVATRSGSMTESDLRTAAFGIVGGRFPLPGAYVEITVPRVETLYLDGSTESHEWEWGYGQAGWAYSGLHPLLLHTPSDDNLNPVWSYSCTVPPLYQIMAVTRKRGEVLSSIPIDFEVVQGVTDGAGAAYTNQEVGTYQVTPGGGYLWTPAATLATLPPPANLYFDTDGRPEDPPSWWDGNPWPPGPLPPDPPSLPMGRCAGAEIPAEAPEWWPTAWPWPPLPRYDARAVVHEALVTERTWRPCS